MERPHVNVRVSFANADYINVCADFGPSDDRKVITAWQELGDLLAGRSGWHFDIVSTSGGQREALWSLGTFGASLLNIGLDAQARFRCFDYLEDQSQDCSSVADVERWLTGREERAKKPNAAQLELAQADDWWGLKSHRYVAVVSWSDGYYSATVLGAMLDAAFGETLQQAVNRAGEMICDTYDAPPELAAELKLAVELEPSAVDRIRQYG